MLVPGRIGATGRPFPELPEPLPLPANDDGHGPARVIALCNQKGGVGKTTSTINLGAALAELGRRVLLLDFDPQGALSVGLGVNPHELDRSVYNLLVEPGITVDDVLLKTNIPGLDLLPSNIDLSAAEVQLVSEVAREHTLTRVLQPVLPDYDYVLIDCQPSLGLLTVNALTAADGVIVPLECEFFALRGVALLTETIRKIRDRLNPRLEIEGILATMYDARTVHGREVLARLVEAFGDTVFHTVIARTVRFPETTVVGEPITSYAPTSPGAVAYRTLAREVLAREGARFASRTPGASRAPGPAASPVSGPAVDPGPDLAPDLATDLVPDLAPDQAPDLVPDLAPDLAPDRAPDLAPDQAQAEVLAP
jgi:chromosome partitioning protein